MSSEDVRCHFCLPFWTLYFDEDKISQQTDIKLFYTNITESNFHILESGIIFWLVKRKNTSDNTIFNITEGNIAGLAKILLQIRTFYACCGI